MSKFVAIVGRCLVALLFVIAGANKLMALSGFQGELAETGLSTNLALPIAIFEIVAGILLALGFMTRLMAVLLAVYTVLVILFFYNQFNDPVEGPMALQSLAVIGGLLLAFAHSHMWGHYYTMRESRRSELAARDAEQRAHEAEVRAARAEAAADAVRSSSHDYHDGVAEHPRDTPLHHRRRWRLFDW